MKSRLIKVLLISMLVILLAVPVVSAKDFIGIATGSTGGTFYPAGVALFETTHLSVCHHTRYNSFQILLYLQEAHARRDQETMSQAVC